MVRDNFAIFILSHGRPDEVFTVKTLQKVGYTGKYYFIIDNEDDTVDGYRKLFGEDRVIVFDKAAVAKKFDVYDNFDGRNVVVYARNVCFDIARELKLDYFAEFEDDYLDFRYRVPEGQVLRSINIEDFDAVCEAMLDFLDSTGVRTIAFAQNGEMAGGVNSNVWKTQVKRKAMNTFYFKVGKPEDDFYFLGRFNDDVNAYTVLGQRGEIFLQTPIVNLGQVITQSRKGGNTEAYKAYGTYVKSFYSILACPHSVKIAMVGESHPRLHHTINLKTCVPKIISDRFRN